MKSKAEFKLKKTTINYIVWGFMILMIVLIIISLVVTNGYNKKESFCLTTNEQVNTGLNDKLDLQDEKIVNLYIATMNRLDEITQQNEYIINALNDK